MFLWWPSTKVVQAVMIRQKTWPLCGRGLFSLYIYIKNFKNLFVRNRYTEFNVTWQEWWPSTKIVQAFMIRQKTGPPEGAELIFRIYLYRKLWNSSCQIPLTDFNVALVTLYQECSSNPDLSKKHGCSGVGHIFPIYLDRKLWKSSCQKPLNRFQFNLV